MKQSMSRWRRSDGWQRWAWLTALALPFFLRSALAMADSAVGTSGILFEVRSPEAAAPNFLFGTIHSEDARVTALPAPVRVAFEASQGFAMEVVPDAQAVIRSMVTMTYTDGRTLRSVLPSELYRETAAALAELGMSEEAFKDLKPWAVMTLMSVPPGETGEFLDIRLYRDAVAERKRVKGLETIEEQLTIFDDLTEVDQIAMLRETLATRHRLPVMFEELTLAYLGRDLDGLRELSLRYLRAGEPRLATLFQATVLDARNRRMVERMRPLLGQGGWFIGIGALHLPGETGIIQLLRGLNYRVSALY